MTGIGIHGNDRCEQCGACCIYFKILEDDMENVGPVETGRLPQKVFKEEGETCKYLRFDDKTKKTHCLNYDSRPKMCSQFSCYDNNSLRVRGEQAEAKLRKDLTEIAGNIF